MQNSNEGLPLNKCEFLLGWFLQELSAPFLFLNALCRPEIRWRSGIYRLKWGGKVEEAVYQPIFLSSKSKKNTSTNPVASLKNGN